ncbi:Ku protein [Streptomyces sp. 2RAF24]|uniref:non-homologous end joining protein Ku n=1 Tax=Streptomyces sp. 2RAF24 TaxID=3232997 RepID=UPI003F97C5F9
MPARPIWKGAISFGLVTVPVALEPATESHNVSFRQVHLADGGRVRYRKTCEIDGQELREDQIGKGYELTKDNVVLITDEDLDGMPLPTAKAIEIVAFVDSSSVDATQYGAGAYYLAADGPVAAKPYVLLRKALERTEKAAVAKFALRGRERLGILRPVGDALLLQGLHWGDEIRSPAELVPPDTDLTEEEVDRALALMETMSTDHLEDLGEQLTDHYTDALIEVINAKAEHRTPALAEGEEAPAAQVVDLMAALEASVAKAREDRGEGPTTPGTVHAMPKKKAAAKNVPAKKASAKKTTGRRKSA